MHLLQTLVDLGLTDDWQHMIDSTTVRGHVSAVGGKGEVADHPDGGTVILPKLDYRSFRHSPKNKARH